MTQRQTGDIYFDGAVRENELDTGKIAINVRANDAYCPVTQAWRISCPITRSNYKYDV